MGKPDHTGGGAGSGGELVTMGGIVRAVGLGLLIGATLLIVGSYFYCVHVTSSAPLEDAARVIDEMNLLFWRHVEISLWLLGAGLGFWLAGWILLLLETGEKR